MTILHIDTSIQGEQSASRRLSAAIVARLRGEQPGVGVAYRDLAAAPIDHLRLDRVSGPETNPDLAQFLAADTVVIGAGMYNFGIPSQLTAWIDRVVIGGHTFAYGDGGPVGLTSGKRVILAVTRGGLYAPGTPGSALEHDVSYLRAVFGFIGIDDVTAIVAEGLKVSDAARDAAIAAALDDAARLPLAA